MKNNLLYEEIGRINFLMNYDSSKLITEQKKTKTPTLILQEDDKQPQGQPQGEPTPQQLEAAKQKIQKQANTTARQIYDELMKAFDVDGDKDLKDYDGTNENAALKAIKKIKNKETLDALNKIIKSWKQFNGLRSWVNSEMSDFDSEYGNIWNNLEKVGYHGANKNILLKVAGYTPAGLMIKGADKAIDTLRTMSFEDIMEGLRSLVGGVGGTIATTILAATGPIGGSVNVMLYAVLTAFDIYQLTTGSKKFEIFNLILDILSTALAGVGVAKALSPVKAAVAGEKTVEGFMKTVSSKFPELAKWLSKIGKFLGNVGAKIAGFFNKGIVWLTQKLPFLTKILQPLKSAIKNVGGWAKSLATKFGSTALGQGVQTIAQSIGTVLQKVGAKSGDWLMKFMKSNVGTAALKEIDAQIIKYIEGYLYKNGKSYAINDIRPVFCKTPDSNYCVAFDRILQSVDVAYSVKKVGKDVKKGLKSGKEFKQSKQFGDALKTTQGLTKGVKTGYKEFKKADEFAGQLSDLENKNKNVTT